MESPELPHAPVPPDALDDAIAYAPTGLLGLFVIESAFLLEINRGLDAQGGAAFIPLAEEKIPGIALAFGQAEGIQIDAAIGGRVNPAQIQGEFIVDENPYVIVAAKGEVLAFLIDEGSMRLQAKSVIVNGRLGRIGFAGTGGVLVEMVQIVQGKKLLIRRLVLGVVFPKAVIALAHGQIQAGLPTFERRGGRRIGIEPSRKVSGSERSAHRFLIGSQGRLHHAESAPNRRIVGMGFGHIMHRGRHQITASAQFPRKRRGYGARAANPNIRT